MSSYHNAPMDPFEISFAATAVGEAADADQALLDATLREAAADAKIEEAVADENLTEDESDALRLLAEIEKAKANNAMTQAMGAASRFEWEVSQIPGQSE